MALNLFDFSNLNPVSKIGFGNTQHKMNISQPTGGGLMPPTKTAKPLLPNVGKLTEDDVKMLNFAVEQKGLSKEEAINLLAKFKEQSNKISETTVQPQNSSLKNIVGGVSEGLYGGLGNLGDIVPNMLFKPAYEAITGNKAQETKSGEEASKFARTQLQKIGYNPNTVPANIGKFVGELLPVLAVPETLGADVFAGTSKVLGKYSPEIVSQGMKYIASNFPKLSKTTELIAKSIPEGAIWQGTSEGKITPEGTLSNAIIAGPTADLIKGLPLLNKYLGKSEIKYAGQDVVRDATGKILNTVKEVEGALTRLTGAADRKSFEQAKSTISQIGKSKNIDEFKLSIDRAIKEQSGIKENLLKTDKTSFKPKDTVISKEYNGVTTKVNPVSNALQDLNQKGLDLTQEGITKVKYYIKKYKTEGLTRSEIDDIAKTYGTQFDAFKKGGDIIKSKGGYETTREGLKEVSRRGFEGGTISKDLDKNISDLLATKETVDKLLEQTNKSIAYTKETWGEGLGRLLANVLDRSTFGIARGALRTIFGAGKETAQKFGKYEAQKFFKQDMDLIQKSLNGINGSKTKEEALMYINDLSKQIEGKPVIQKSKPLKKTKGQIKSEGDKLRKSFNATIQKQLTK